MWQAIALSFGLAMDATAVSAGRGLAKHARHELFVLPLVFGGFQAGMAALGHFASKAVGTYIDKWDHWVAFVLLVGIGLKMLWEALRGDGAREQPAGSVGLYIALGLATSIDAAAAGITLNLVPVETWVALVLIGGVTAACSAVGYVAGKVIESKLGTKLEILGGLVLIGIGTELLLRGL
jgi:putative Mn2+ efflux pump MntP